MPRRQLNHLARIALQETWPLILESFVLYTEPYAGSSDTGVHQLERLDGQPALSWQYTTIHLWREPAEPLLLSGKPGIIPIMGLMKIEQPQTTLPQMVQQIEAVPDAEKRGILFSSLLALISDEELLAMAEQLIEDDYMLDTPFMRRIRDQIKSAQVEAEQAQREAEQAQREAEQAQREAEQAGLVMRRADIVEIIVARLDPRVKALREIEQQLAQIEDLNKLQKVLVLASSANSVEDINLAIAQLKNEN